MSNRSTNIDPRVIWKLHRALYGLRTSPKMWQQHLHSTVRGLHLQRVKADRCVWAKANIMVLAYVDDLLIAGTSRETSLFLEQFRQPFSLKHSTVLTTQQPLRFLGKRLCRHLNGDITVSLERSYYYSMLKHMDLDDNVNPTSTPSLRRPPGQQDAQLDMDRRHIYRKVVGMLIWASLVLLDLQFTAKDSARRLAAPTEWDWARLKHTLRFIKGTLNYKFLISPRLPQGHSLPLRQLIPLHINTYCDSNWATDIESPKCTSGTVTSVLGVPLAFNSRTQSTVATSSAEAELYAIGLGISDSLHTYQLLQELQQHLQRSTFDFGNVDIQYNIASSRTSTSLTSTKPPIHIFTDSTSALSLSNKLGLNKRSKHIALRYLFVQDIQATGLVNIQRVTSYNNPADIYTKCVTSPVLERHLRHNGSIELHIEEGEINYFHILELAEQYFNATSDEDVEYTREQRQKMKDNNEYTKQQRLRIQQKVRNRMKQLYLNKQKKKDNKKLHIENKRREAAQRADIEHKQSQLLLQHQDRSHKAQAQQREAHLEHMMEECRSDLGNDYIPFINMIDINYVNNRPQPRPEHLQQTTLPLDNGRATADIMADLLLRKQQQQQQLQRRSSSSHLGGDEVEGGWGEETSRRRVRSPSPTSAAAEQS